MIDSHRVAIAHDYLTQRGGAERVVLSLAKAFPDAPILTSLYDPKGTFPEFAEVDVRVTPLDRVGVLRRHHRLALPFLAPAFSRVSPAADLVVCSSSGWAHGVSARGRKVVYCHAPARWLYQQDRYATERLGAGRVALAALRSPLLAWDRRAAASADRYLVNSTLVRGQVRDAYGIDAEVVPPPPTLDPDGSRAPVDGVEPGYYLCVSRLLPYKNVAAVVAAFAALPDQRLVVVGDGPQADDLRRAAPANVRLVGVVGDEQLRWLYANSVGLVAPAYEDFGLTPLEAASFGKPTVALRFGGYLDTVVDGETGLFFDRPEAGSIGEALGRASGAAWQAAAIQAHAERFSEQRFIDRLRAVAAEELGARP